MRRMRRQPVLYFLWPVSRRFAWHPIWRLWLHASAALLAISSVSGLGANADLRDGSELEISGSAVFKLLSHDGTIRWVANYTYTVDTAKGGWRIDLSGQTPEGQSFESAGSDGIDTYEFLDNSKKQFSNQLASASVAPAAKVCARAFPSCGTKPLQILWLTLLYSSIPKNEFASNPVVLSEINYAVNEGAQIAESFNQDGSFLTGIQYLSNGRYYSGGTIRKTLPPFEDGYKLWEISITNPTNFQGRLVPLAGRYRQFLPLSGRDGKCHLVTIWDMDITVGNIARLPVNERSFLPLITNTSLSVIDYRFNTSGSPPPLNVTVPVAVYNLAHGRWLNRTEAALFDNFHSISASNSGSKTASRRGIWGVGCLFAITAAFPIVWIILARRNKRQTNTN